MATADADAWRCEGAPGNRGATPPAEAVAAPTPKRQSSVGGAPTKQLPDVALVIKPVWTNEIFEHNKTWEIRGERTRKRGRVAIAASGTGTLVGEATFVNCLEVGRYEQATKKLRPFDQTTKHHKVFLGNHFSKHRIKDLSTVKYPKVFAWVLAEAVRYENPVPYKHPQVGQ